MSKLNPKDIGGVVDCFYLPHHAVTKKDSTTTKLRVVFDGSANTSSGISLNETQMVGPPMQDELFSILLRFREHSIVLSADVAKMYRQILVREKDRYYQRILWRFSEDEPISEYCLNTVGKDCAQLLPCTSETILRDFYVDDLLTGCETFKQALELQNSLISTLAKAGFPLRKWASNDPRLTDQPHGDNQGLEFKSLNREPKTLGLLWSAADDKLGYSSEYNLFPKIGWDESLPQTLHSQWLSLRNEIAEISSLRIPRRALSSHEELSMHGFCNASERAYGAAVYLRSRAKDGSWVVRLLCAKSRVAPLKTISLPRLELCGAVLLARLVARVRASLRIEAIEVHCWTDNQLSRGSSPSTLRNSNLWWYGPQWLSANALEWPSSGPDSLTIEVPEARPTQIIQLTTPVNRDHAIHLELSTDLTTDSFLNCFRRFISRRGKCRVIYSDNGTNFIGARNELKDLGELLASRAHNEKCERTLAQNHIQWQLIPPRAPHFGGLWERGVRSVKTHLRRVIGEQRLTFEEMCTILAQIEAYLNSRPLHPLSSDPSDLNPLTPGHFLVGEALTTLPHADLTDIRQNRLNRFQLLQQTIQHFWRRWQRDYLHNLQQRHKWKQRHGNPLKVGDMVLIKEDNLPPLKWALGRVVELHPGQDAHSAECSPFALPVECSRDQRLKFVCCP
ncbi:uncharacterized protein LOC143259842 [Megalopta genalis]|uniref:uncharacterized protein LOC143259842 n=1 Tax=Megalopta genalis TaxID=115081 RepID=UPI003FD57D9E